MKLINADKLIGVISLLDTPVLRASPTASYIFDQILYDIQHMPDERDAPNPDYKTPSDK